MKAGFAGILWVGMILGLSGMALPAKASQFYAGVQATSLSTHLDYGNGSESYNLNPTRVELGWRERSFYWAIHILTSGQDTDIDTFGATYQMKMDTSYGIFVGLNMPNYYLSLGLQSFDTRYHLLSSATADKSNLVTLGFQLGIQHEILPNLSLYADFSYYAGRADYPTYFTSSPDFSAHGFAGGIKYTFY